MPKAKGKVHVKDLKMVPDTRRGRSDGGAVNSDDLANTEDQVIGQRAKGSVSYVDGSNVKELGSFDLSLASALKKGEVEDAVKAEVNRIVQANGLDADTEVVYEK